MPKAIPVMLGYLPLGMAFGMLLSALGYPWYVATLMSVVIYAGSGQFLAVSFFAAGTGYGEIALTTFLLNSRHIFFGLSLLDRFAGIPGKIKSYLIFALTDETFGLMTTRKPPEGMQKKYYYLLISLMDHIYWITGSTIGAIGGTYLKINTQGMDFSLTALFVVLAIEQYKSKKKLLPFGVAFCAGILALIAVPVQNMLIFSILLSVFIILGIGRMKKQWK
jgi:4-azaleucine resistance transporter AzlC